MDKKQFMAGALAALTVVGSTPAAFAAQKDTQVPYAVMSAQALEDAGISLLSQEEENETAPLASTLQDQINNAQAGQQTTITLQGDTSENLTIPAGKEIILNLGTFTLTNKTKTHTITNKGTLTIIGTGTVDNTTHGTAAVFNDVGGTAVLNGGTYTRSQENGQNANNSGDNSYYNIVNWGEMTINMGVTVRQNGHFSSMIENGFYNGDGKTNNPKLTINGGTFSGGLNTVKNDDRGVLEIKDGSFTNVSQAALLNWNEATIKGGTFKADSGAEAVILNGYINDSMDSGSLTIDGGQFVGVGNAAVIKQMPTDAGSKSLGTVEINSGRFETGDGEIISVEAGTADMAKINIVSGSFSTSNTESKAKLGQYVDPSSDFDVDSGTVSATTAEQAAASIGTKNYKNFADAVAAVKDNETITLLKDVTLTADLSIENGKTFTIDLNRKTLSGADIFIKGSAFVTARNGKICGDVWLKTTNEDKPYNSFTLANDAEIETNGYGIVVTQLSKGADNYGSTVNIQGSVTGKESTLWVLGNITTDLKTARNPVTVNVGSTAKLTNSDQTNTALQMAGACVVTVEDGAQITGGTAIEVRAGKLTVKGGTITGTGTATEVQPNGNGTSTKGAGIGIAQHTTKQPIEVIISGGKISGHTAFFESNPQKNEGEAQQKIELNIAGGEFTATNGGTNAVSSESGKTNFVTGGTFSSPVDKDYLKGLNAELKANSGNAPYSYYVDEAAAKAANEKNGNTGTVKVLRMTAVSASVADPAKGADLATNVTIPADAKYTGSVEWLDGQTPVTGKAKGGKTYTAKITLTAKEGESFAESLNGTTVDDYTVAYVSQKTVTLTKTFGVTEAAVLQGLTVTGYTGGQKKDGDTISKDELTVKATYDDGTEDANYQDYEIVYANGDSLKRGDTSIKVKKGDTVVSSDFTISTVDGKTVTADLFTFTAPTLTYNGSDQIAAIQDAVSVKTEFAGKVGNITVTLKQADADVAAATNAGTYDIYVTCDAGTEYDAQTTPIKVGSVTIARKALEDADFTKGANPVYNGMEQSAPVTTNLTDADYDVSGTAKLTNVSEQDVTIIYTGKGNYTGSVNVSWNLAKATPTAADFTIPAQMEKTYTGSPLPADALTTTKTGMGSVTLKYAGSGTAPTYAGTYALTFDVAEGGNYTAANGLSAGDFVIAAAEQNPSITKTAALTTGGKTLDLAALVQNAKGTVSFEIASGDAATLNGSVLTPDAAKSGEVKITVKITAKDENNDGTPEYSEYTGSAAITVTVSEQQKETVAVAANDITVVYGGNAVSADKITGTATFNGKAVAGTWEWKAGQDITNVADSGKKTVVFKPTDSNTYADAETELTLTIQKAKVTGTPSWTEIQSSGMTLADAKLGMGTLLPTGGTLAWTLPENTVVQANTSYEWSYTPADAANYETLTGSVTLLHRYYSGGSWSGSSTYPVSVPRVDNGSISVTPGAASKGTTVTITVKPNDGYELSKLTVTDQSGNRLSLNDQGNDKYTFTMPSGKVNVDAAFSKIETTMNFWDVKQGDYYYDAVKWAVEKRITEGTGANFFSPNASCTRAQMVTFLWRAAGSPAPKSTVNPFTDVSASDYFYNAVLWAVENGITTGASADRFAPGATVSRAQTVTFLYRANGSPAASGASFSDVAADDYYANAVAWAVQNGITTGTGNGKFSPNADCTRGQIVTLLYRADTK